MKKAFCWQFYKEINLNWAMGLLLPYSTDSITTFHWLTIYFFKNTESETRQKNSYNMYSHVRNDAKWNCGRSQEEMEFQLFHKNKNGDDEWKLWILKHSAIILSLKHSAIQCFLLPNKSAPLKPPLFQMSVCKLRLMLSFGPYRAAQNSPTTREITCRVIRAERQSCKIQICTCQRNWFSQLHTLKEIWSWLHVL